MEFISKQLEEDRVGDNPEKAEKALQSLLNEEIAEIPLSDFIQLAKVVFTDDRVRITAITDYCYGVKREENLRYALEWAQAINNQELFQDLVERNKAIGGINLTWAKVYEEAMALKGQKKDPRDVISFAYQFRTDSLELKCQLVFLIVYSYYNIREYQNLERYAPKLTSYILKVQDPFMRESFNLRLSEVLFHVHWKRNERTDLEQARHYAVHFIRSAYTPEKRINMLQFLGQTYLFDSYDKAIHYVMEAKKIAGSIGRYDMKELIQRQTIPFIGAHWNRLEYVDLDDIEQDELAHIEISKGNNEKAVEILSKLKEENGEFTPFQLYYMGKALNDRELLLESYISFKTRHDHFFAKLPEAELIKFT